MEAAICTLVSQFKSFAGKDGSSSTLSKDEFRNLVASQLSNFVEVRPRSSIARRTPPRKTSLLNSKKPLEPETGSSRVYLADCSSCVSAGLTTNETNALVLMTVICLTITFTINPFLVR